ncbi:flagellar hook-basal body complex protein [Bordetella bronchiseptica]|uniref:flagellar hook-basal body complex protein n=1 Tax=Bordetella bronchiseptica TaxID=518 RepID=UPI0004614AFD|nr:flagellar hook-basal body complex protein [Bordetella bronchiseptica]KDD13061.1 flagellar hook-basal body protein [Bordetella bronchiseptica MBORD731]
MGFGQGLSGLNAASQNLDVIGNNIANSGTVGFKSGAASFADVYASSRVGLGVKVSAINQRFTVGNISTTGGEYDMAIDGGKGFFRLTDQSGGVFYSRNGEFMVDKNFYIVNAQGFRLTGYPAGGVGAQPVDLQLPQGNIAPQATSTAGLQTNLNANAKVIDPNDTPADDGAVELDGTTYRFTNAGGTFAWVAPAPLDGTYNGGDIVIAGGVVTGDLASQPGYQPYKPLVAGIPFDPTNPLSYTDQVPTTVYDSLGNSHQMIQYFAKRPAVGTESVYEVYYVLDGQPMQVNGGASQTLNFDTAGNLLNQPPTAQVTFANPGGNAAPADPLAITVSYNGVTQYGSDFAPKVVQNGYSSGEFMGLSVGKDGSLVAKYTNGETQTIGTLVLANFNNVQGLQPVGNNAWVETSESGQATLGQPGTNGLATIAGQALEASNVDMSRELVNMIVAQRTYQANAQTIKTQDEVMQVLMNMR